MVKLCRDCRHYHAETFGAMGDYCSHPDLRKPPDLVRGELTLTYCQLAREDDAKCGREGVRWEAKT